MQVSPLEVEEAEEDLVTGEAVEEAEVVEVASATAVVEVVVAAEEVQAREEVSDSPQTLKLLSPDCAPVSGIESNGQVRLSVFTAQICTNLAIILFPFLFVSN